MITLILIFIIISDLHKLCWYKIVVTISINLHEDRYLGHCCRRQPV